MSYISELNQVDWWFVLRALIVNPKFLMSRLNPPFPFKAKWYNLIPNPGQEATRADAATMQQDHLLLFNEVPGIEMLSHKANLMKKHLWFFLHMDSFSE